jgi:glycosyltransferase involved in cell wall biosynthesis
MRLQIFVFSYNRADFLRNCVESILQCAIDCPVTVVDDNSDDAATRAYLANLPDGVKLLQPEVSSEDRHGGLYNNMQLALDHANSTDAMLIIQDDMQLVRPLSEDDYRYIEDFFNHFSTSAFLGPVFLKGRRRYRNRRITRLASDFPVYFRRYRAKKDHRGLHYGDVAVAHVGRLREAGWRFKQGEVANAEVAAVTFGEMGYMAHPFVMYLPQVPVYRGKRKSMAVTMAERWSGSSPKRLLTMTAEQTATFKERPLTTLPVAENYLQCSDASVKRPFHYTAVNAYPLLRALHKLELLMPSSK